jgi:hypothetical protein
MFDVSPRDRAMYEARPSREVTAMMYGRLNYRHEAQAVHPAGRHPVKPWADVAMPDQRQRRAPRMRKPRPTFTPAVAAALAEYQRSRAAHQATG